MEQVGGRRLVCVGEASHGTHEFYSWRADLSRRLIEEHGFTWIGVEGDWPDCWRINRWVRGLADQELDAAGVLSTFERWPTWMWANREVADFLDWLRHRNLQRPAHERVGFYGLDVYSLWDSLRVIMDWLEEHDPEALAAASRAWQCFLPYGEDPQRYAQEHAPGAGVLRVRGRRPARRGRPPDGTHARRRRGRLRRRPERRGRRRTPSATTGSWSGATASPGTSATATWRTRSSRLDAHLGPGAKGLVWEHNTHVGDARATDMARAGMVNVGQLVRERFGDQTSRWSASPHTAAPRWRRRPGVGPSRCCPVPTGPGREAMKTCYTGRWARRPCSTSATDDRGPWLSARAGHRAIGVVYQPRREAGNYVPTVMGGRYDALLWLENTTALRAVAP